MKSVKQPWLDIGNSVLQLAHCCNHITQINSGQVEQAEGLLDGILASTPHDLSALVARGTARALRRKLKEAVDDFSKAIAVEPRCVSLLCYLDSSRNI